MSQQMNILCCYSCEMFQVHIVKKAKKWQCKVCNAKQSIRRVYFQGSGKDCRLHVQQLNSQKQNGFESVQAAPSNIDDSNDMSDDIKESLANDQQMSEICLNESEVILDNVMQTSNEEYIRDEQIMGNNYESSKSNLSNDLTCEIKSFDRTSSEVKEPRFVNSKSTGYINNNTKVESTTNDIKENHNIFESYEDFDSDLDF